MSIDSKFYIDIFKREEYWTAIASDNLLNIYYLKEKDGIREFYQERYNILNEINKENNPNLLFIINMIKEILTEIDRLIDLYNEGKEINVNKLVNLFIINQITK